MCVSADLNERYPLSGNSTTAHVKIIIDRIFLGLEFCCDPIFLGSASFTV